MTKAEKLAQRLEKEAQKNIEYWQSLTSDVWDLPVYNEGAGWDMTDVLVHIVATEDAMCRLISRIVETGEGVAEDFDIDEFNEERVAKQTERNPEKLTTQFLAYRNETVNTFNKFTDTDLEKEGNHPFLKRAKVVEMIKLMYLHVQLHIRDMRRVVDAATE